MNRRLFLGALTGAGVALLILGIGYGIGWIDARIAPPTHIEADNYRYLDPHMGDVPAAQPSLPSTPPCGGSVPCNQVLAAQSPVDGGAYVYDGKKWRKVPVVQGDCTILKSGAMECCGGPGHPACDDDPYAIQGQWMAERGDHCTINGYTDVLCDNPCDTTGISLKEWETYSCTVDALDVTNITTGCLVGVPCNEPNPDTPPAVLKEPPTQVCVYDFVGSPYLRLNKAVSDPSCADFASPPAVLAVPPAPQRGDCFVYSGEDTFEKVDQCPVTDDNSEELEQDDYNNEITDGSQI